MSYTVSELLLRNLRDVFGENDPARSSRGHQRALQRRVRVLRPRTRGPTVVATRSTESPA